VFANAASGVGRVANGKPPWVGSKTFAGLAHCAPTDNPAEHFDATGGINADRAKYEFIFYEFDFVKIL